MSVQRRVNWLSQQRVDTPDMRSVESAASNDFDQLIQAVITGAGNGYVMRGFTISMAGAIGGAASGLQMAVDPGAVLHVNSSQSGTFYMVPSGTASQQLNSATNSIVDGAFAPSAINYIGLEYERFIDDSTSSQVYLWNPTTNNETTKNAPRAQILRYRIKISTSIPASNVMPIATVVTDAGNNVVSVTDARPLFGRLGKGGFNADPFNNFTWTQGRTENSSSSTSNSTNPFYGGDKSIGNLKDWMDAIMTSVQEIKGTTYWYSQSSSGSLESLREDLGNTIITGRGTITHAQQAAGQINWDEDIEIRVVGSRLAYTLVGNPTSTDITLTDDKVAYITLVRGVTVIPNLVFTNLSAVITSVGNVAWTSPLQAGDWVKLGSETDSGYYEIQSVDSLTQVTLTEPYGGSSTGVQGAKAKYAFGKYSTSPTPNTNRNIYIADRKSVPQGENVFWLFLRSDNGGSTARVYIRFLGSEISQGESESVSDNVPLNLLQYVGSPLESASKPQYASALNSSAAPQVTQIRVGDATTVTSGQYFYIYSSGNNRKYYAWINKDGTGTDPKPNVFATGLQWNVTTGQSASDVAASLLNALNGTYFGDFTVTQVNDVLTVTNASGGATTTPVNFNLGAPFSLAVARNGVGIGNYSIQDGDDLTLAIKKIDDVIGNFMASLEAPGYDEIVSIVASGATPPGSITGPISSGSYVTLPNNSREGNQAVAYSVGSGKLQVFLNGQKLIVNVDYSEVGTTEAPSNQIEILADLVIGDELEFTFGGGGAGAGGGGGEQGPQGLPGPAGPAGPNAIGGPVAISTKNGNYTATDLDCFLRADCTSNNVTFTLPPASSVVGKIYYFKKIDASSNAMGIQAYGSEVIDGVNSISSVTQYESFSIVSTGGQWDIF